MLKLCSYTARNTRYVQVAAIFSAFALAQVAVATPLDAEVGYKVTICESLDVLKHPNNMQAAMQAAWVSPAELAMARSEPYMRLKNTSETANLKDFYMTIGDTEDNFDFARAVTLPAGVKMKVVGLDTKNGGKHSDLLHLQFTGFQPGMSVYFQIDIDPDKNLMQFGDYRSVLFTLNGGPNTSGNSETRARFVDSSLPPADQRFLTPSLPWANPVINYSTIIGMEPRATYQMDHVQPFGTGNNGLQPVPEPSAFALAGLAVAGLACFSRRTLAAA
jgi:hypothetical protein